MAARRTPTPSNEREPETSPWNTDPFPSPVRLAVGDDNDGELAMELAAEFAIEICVLKKRLGGVTCEPGGGGGQKVPEAPAPAAPRRAPFMANGISCDPPPLLCVLQQTE